MTNSRVRSSPFVLIAASVLQDERAHTEHLREQLRAVSRALGNQWCDAGYADLPLQVARYRVLADTVRAWAQAIDELNGIQAAEQVVRAALVELDTAEGRRAV